MTRITCPSCSKESEAPYETWEFGDHECPHCKTMLEIWWDEVTIWSDDGEEFIDEYADLIIEVKK